MFVCAVLCYVRLVYAEPQLVSETFTAIFSFAFFPVYYTLEAKLASA